MLSMFTNLGAVLALMLMLNQTSPQQPPKLAVPALPKIKLVKAEPEPKQQKRQEKSSEKPSQTNPLGKSPGDRLLISMRYAEPERIIRLFMQQGSRVLLLKDKKPFAELDWHFNAVNNVSPDTGNTVPRLISNEMRNIFSGALPHGAEQAILLVPKGLWQPITQFGEALGANTLKIDLSVQPSGLIATVTRASGRQGRIDTGLKQIRLGN